MRYFVAAVALALLAACSPSNPTVPAAILSASTAATITLPARVDVRAVALAEIDHIDRQVSMPPLYLAIIDRWGMDGHALITAQPVRYSIIIWARYWSEAQARFVAAHEAGHIMIDAWGMTQSEPLADLFGLCYGSPAAQTYAKDVRGVSGDCAVFEAGD